MEIAGWTLIVGFVLFMVGAGGWKPEYQADLATRLAAVHRDRGRTLWIHLWMLVAMAVTPAGLFALALVSGQPWVAVAAGAYAVGAVPWVLFLAFRVTVQLEVAQAGAAGSGVPDWFEPIERWINAGHRFHMHVAYASAVPLGIGLGSVGQIPGWLGWAGVVFGSVWTAGLLHPRMRYGFEPPFWAHVYTFVVGVAVL